MTKQHICKLTSKVLMTYKIGIRVVGAAGCLAPEAVAVLRPARPSKFWQHTVLVVSCGSWDSDSTVSCVTFSILTTVRALLCITNHICAQITRVIWVSTRTDKTQEA